MIELKDVSYVYHLSDTDGNRIINPVISHLSMTIPGGEFVVLTGSSGCGKTTLCRMINGLVPHYFEGELKGKILVDGEEVSSQPIYQTAKKLVVFSKIQEVNFLMWILQVNWLLLQKIRGEILRVYCMI